MKNVFCSILMLFLLQVGTVTAITQVPTELHGYWQLKDSEDGWGGMNVGKNYVEIFYDLMTIDSIHHLGKEYTMYMTREKNQHLTLTVELLANDSAVFKIKEFGKSLLCKHYNQNPEIDFLPVADYSKAVSVKWFTDSNTREPFAIEKGKLLYIGKRWNILWLGEYKKREYRALIETDGNYRLIYFTKQDDSSLKVTYYQKSTIYKPLTDVSGKLAIFGNWFEPNKNIWTFGFFEKFAIYKEKFWEYKTLNISKNKGKATLQNGNDSLQLTFKKIKDKTMQVACNNQKVVTYHLAGRTLPHFKMTDTTSFVDNHFARIDTAYITGYLRNRQTDKPFEISLHDVIADKEVSYYGNVDNAGRFEIKVPLYNSSMAFLDWKQIRQMNVLEPNEHYFLFYDGNTKQTLFMGKNTRCQNELASMDFFGIPREQPESGMKPINFLVFQKMLFNKEKEYIKGLFDQMPNPSEKFRYFLNNYIKYEIAFDLLQYRFKLDRKNNERFPDEYLGYVKNTMLTNPVNPMTLSRSIFTFIRDYVDYFNDIKGNYSITSNDALLSLLATNKLKVDKSDNEIVVLINNYLGLINAGDTVKSKKMAENISSKQFERYNEISRQNQGQITKETSTMLSDIRLKRKMETLSTEIQDKTIRDYYLAYALFGELNDARIPIDTKLLDSIIIQVNSQVFREKVLVAQKFYTELSERSMDYTESLKNTDHLIESKNTDSLWLELTRPYKGKIIYVDFWGTWCGPCKMEMEYVSELKKQFIDKDVIFMYLANRSSEESWKNVIKNYSLTGENVVHYRLPEEQQAMIERRFGVNSFPTYMIVDKNGNIVDTKPPRPSQKEITVGFLNRWLEKKINN